MPYKSLLSSVLHYLLKYSVCFTAEYGKRKSSNIFICYNLHQESTFDKLEIVKLLIIKAI